MDVPEKGIRVINVEPGLVRTEFPEGSHQGKSPTQREATLPLEAEDVAKAIAYALGQPPRVSVNEILLRPTEQPI